MFQLTFKTDIRYAEWFYSIEEAFAIKIKRAGGVYAKARSYGTINVAIASPNENKQALLNAAVSSLADMYATVVKYDYLKNRLKLPLDKNSYNLLLHTLVAFDRENEREPIKNAVTLCNGASLEGIFYFKMNELKLRWEEISELAASNAMYLTDEDTLNELIRFLISAVNPKINSLEIKEQDNKYSVSGRFKESDFMYYTASTQQLLLYLIDIAPVELKLNGNFSDGKLCNRLMSIFDAKRSENCNY